jgi:hypothetical protein
VSSGKGEKLKLPADSGNTESGNGGSGKKLRRGVVERLSRESGKLTAEMGKEEGWTGGFASQFELHVNDLKFAS